MAATFLLFVIGIILIVLNVRAINKEKNSFNNVLINSEEEMKEYQVELGKLRREFSETILELQRDIEDLKDEIHNNKLDDQSDNKLHSELEDELNNKSNDELNEISSSNKDEIKLNEKIGSNLDLKDEEIENTPEYIYEEDEKKSSNSNSVKINEVHQMIENGMSIDEIAEKTGVGKGELLLIKELYKN